MKYKEDFVILQCSRCRYTIDWNRVGIKPPGDCPSCASNYNSNYDWKVVKEHRKYIPGHVIVVSNKGRQQLYGPSFLEHQDRWIKEE